MKPITKPLVAALGAAIALGGMAAASTAGAAVVCNSFHECWHVHDRLTYPDNAHIVLYDDTWTAPDASYHWLKDRDDHGYWIHSRWHHF